MTSYRQIEANRRNALKSTGPRTEAGKEISRRNAVRHGLTAETVITALEDAEDYQAFEAAMTADYDAQSTVEPSWCCDLPVSSGACVAPRPSKLDYLRSKPNICADTSKAGNYSQIPVVLFTLCCTGRRLAVQLSSSPNAFCGSPIYPISPLIG